MAITSINPATGQLLQEFQPLSESEIAAKLERAASAFAAFRRLPFAARARLMCNAADILEGEKENFGRMMTTEMGKPLRAAIEEAVKCAGGCRYYADNAERFLKDEPVETSATHSYIRYEPLGPILAIMPWNFPFWQVFRFAAPSLMAGNVALLKHAPSVPQCALEIEKVFLRAGFPEGVFQTLLVEVPAIDKILEDPRVAAATLTGSVEAGAQVSAGAAKRIKKTVLELGGSDPFIVMPSARLAEAVETGVKARIQNNGQSCIAGKRFILAESIADEFEGRFTAAMRSVNVGDPFDEKTELGPLVTAEALARLEEQVRKTVDAGARILTGGTRLQRAGNFYEPTVLTDIPKNSPAYCEELFGPVACLFRAKNVADAIALANDTRFGLGASVWTNDVAERDRFISELETGMVFVNRMVASDPRLPFGGMKRSGHGRELGVHGIREFTNIKTVWIQDASR